MIKKASHEDIPEIINLVESLVQSIEGPQRVCRLKTGETIAGLINDPSGVVFISKGGFIAGCIVRTVISNAPVSVELGWHANDKSGLRLLSSFENWSAEMGATLIKVSCKGGSAEEILRRRGYRLAETNWVR